MVSSKRPAACPILDVCLNILLNWGTNGPETFCRASESQNSPKQIYSVIETFF